MISDRPLIGLLFVFAFCLLAPLGDALVKVVGMGAPLMVLLLSRFVFQAVSLAPVVLLSGREFPTDRRIFGLICLRSLFHILGIGMMFTALRLLPPLSPSCAADPGRSRRPPPALDLGKGKVDGRHGTG